MTETSHQTGSTTELSKAGSSGSSGSSSSALVTQYGRTTIADSVVAKIAGIATRDVTGVYAVGGNTARAVGAIRERIPGARVNHTQGVAVEVGERQAAVDLQIVTEYGVPIAELAEAIRGNVIASIERMTGLEVKEVNIDVQDVHLPQESQPAAAPDPEPVSRPNRVE
ncbi:MAG: Asp23/Gls24 family envelope stress response protein [Actinomycetales bacterium]